MVVVLCYYDFLFCPLYFNDGFASVVMIHSLAILVIIMDTKGVFTLGRSI